MSMARGINPGTLNRRIKIYGYKDIDDDLGGSRTVLVEKAEVWANIHPTRGSEFLEYYRESNELQYKVTIRYRDDITVKDVLVRGDQQFTIQSAIDPNDDHYVLEIYCTESKDKEVLYGG